MPFLWKIGLYLKFKRRRTLGVFLSNFRGILFLFWSLLSATQKAFSETFVSFLISLFQCALATKCAELTSTLSFPFRYTFRNDIMEVISADSRIHPYSRVCIQAFPDDKFLVAHEEMGQIRGRYTCMQIKKRSDTVLQILEAELSEKMGRDLCKETLKLDGWIVLDAKNVLNQREDCSLVGGFNMQVYDKSLNKGVCDGYLGETRLESECQSEDGLNFYYRQAKCVPDGLLMYPSQRTYCLANWVDGNSNFILLKHSRQSYLWVFRYPKELKQGEGFNALLMKDLFATNNTIQATSNYLSLSMSRQTPKTLDSLCYDDYEICSVLRDPCSYSDDIARTCAKTCGFCTEKSPSLCQFGLPLNGMWNDTNQMSGGPNVIMNSTSVEIVGQEVLHCIEWSAERPDKRSKGPTATVEQMLVTVSENGCRPRYSCGKFTKFPFNVMFMQLSQTRLWPLVETKEDLYNCNKFSYTNGKDMEANPFRTRHENLLLSDHISGTECDLREYEHFAVLFKDGVRCSGELVQNTNRTSIELNFPECSVQRLRDTFVCLEFALLPPENDRILVTRSVDKTLHCWLFPTKPENIFHLIESDLCNLSMKRRIRKGRLRPIATFSIDPRRKVKVVTESSFTSEEETNIVQHGPVNDTLIVLETVQKVPKLRNKNLHRNRKTKSKKIPPVEPNQVVENMAASQEENSTLNYTVTSRIVTNDTTVSPVVVAAVIFTLLIFQIPLLCQCKCWGSFPYLEFFRLDERLLPRYKCNTNSFDKSCTKESFLSLRFLVHPEPTTQVFGD